jgi:hypothetical protein
VATTGLASPNRGSALAAVAAAAIVVSVTGCGSHQRVKLTTTGVRAQLTSLHIFAPFNGGAIAAGVKIKRTARGYCWTSSGADSRPDAWRCFLGNYILDPCFSNQANATRFVLCAESPWSRLVRLKLTKALPLSLANKETGRPTAKAPWAIELIGGTRCTALTGATGAIAGLGLDYGCTNGGLLAGTPRRDAGAWWIFYAPSYRAKALTTKHISQAWW